MITLPSHFFELKTPPNILLEADPSAALRAAELCSFYCILGGYGLGSLRT